MIFFSFIFWVYGLGLAFFCTFYMFGSVRFWFGKQNFSWLVLFGSGRTVKHCFSRSIAVHDWFLQRVFFLMWMGYLQIIEHDLYNMLKFFLQCKDERNEMSWWYFYGFIPNWLRSLNGRAALFYRKLLLPSILKNSKLVSEAFED